MSSRIGIIGCGRIAEDAHAPALRSLSRADVVALVDPSAERRRAVADALGQSQLVEYSDWREMFASGGLDVVVVALPHHLHARAIEDAARSGVDVISEKPLATTTAEVDAIEKAISAAGVRLAIMHNWMFNPDPVRACQAIAAGLIGEPFLVRNESHTGVEWANRDPAGDWRQDRQQSGGGIVIDNVYHPIYVAEAEMMSPVVRCWASLGGGGLETRALVVLEHENGGATSVQRCSTAVGGGLGVHEVHGSKGSIRFRQPDPLVLNKILAGEVPPPPPPDAPALPSLEIFETDVGEWQALETTPAPWWGGIQSVFEKTLDAWAAGEPAPAGLSEARHVLNVVEALYRSAEFGRAVDVPRLDGRAV